MDVCVFVATFSWRSVPGLNRVGIHLVVPICVCGFDSVFRFCHRIFPRLHTSAGFSVSSGALSSQSCFLLVHPVTVAVSVSFFVFSTPCPFLYPCTFPAFLCENGNADVCRTPPFTSPRKVPHAQAVGGVAGLFVCL